MAARPTLRGHRVLATALAGLAVALAALGVLAPARAEAQVRHVVTGAGFGHGVGMSQYGAFGFAQQGRDYRAILAHYYRGTDLGPTSTRAIRVLLRSSGREAAVQGAASAAGRPLDPRRTYRVRLVPGSALEVLEADGRSLGRFPAPLTVTGSGASLRLLGRALNGVVGGAYRGSLEFRPGALGSLVTVNAAGLDEYVQGVVPGEVPSTWPRESLRAQAVAARSYALATNAGRGVFDQYPDTRSQVYRGLSAERATTNAAVQATAGQVLRYGGRVATTYFFSTSGGRTENVENIFTGARPTPYLVSVPDPYDSASRRHRWRLTFTQAQMQSRLRGLVRGTFRGIRVLRRGVSPRILTAHVVGSGGITLVRGTTLRRRLGLYDTWAYFSTAGMPPAPPRPDSTPPGAEATSSERSARESVFSGAFSSFSRPLDSRSR